MESSKNKLNLRILFHRAKHGFQKSQYFRFSKIKIHKQTATQVDEEEQPVCQMIYRVAN